MEDLDEYNNNLDDFDIDSNSEPFDNLQLNNKQVEPDNKISGKYANRNLQLGFLEKSEFNFFKSQITLANTYNSVPLQEGGWLTREYADKRFRIIDMTCILSCSKGGKLREFLNTRRNINVNKDVNAKKMIDGFSRRNE